MKTLSLIFCALLAGPALATQVDTVLMVSIDALHPAALSEQASPTLQRLMRSGRYTLQGQSVSPPQTLIAHTAMLTGLAPAQSGKQDNNWKPGQPQVARETLLDVAKQRGFQTAYFYAKPKLGYLISAAVDEHALARDDGIDRAQAFFSQPGQRFVFLHISGLEDAGADSGWLSPDYVNELTYIDRTLAPLLDAVAQRGSYLVVVTSDHAGHERQHGTLHPEDFKLPVIMVADRTLPALAPGVLHLTELKGLVQNLLPSAAR
ncbi:MAG: alkaline phosphatase family protein [Gammaproteobacteria bacterium]|nr:alkaline phosphatase family protein [Gammaproteobacteria bacterium]MBU3996315.1 alkaline phosphatase family protein [Gammaproteobacteria bacterium]MBU4080667.1 alkaline phosphatase family protein [Gammaproteobacteria bacterium]MBU4170915.1 alkaline phosphatase family protein [Gammaproteobacteria bacterium]